MTATSDPPAVPELSSELSRGQALALGESFDPEEQARIQQMSHDCSAMGQDVTGTYRTEDQCTKGDLLVTVDPEAVGGPGTVERIERFLDRLTDDGRADCGVRHPGGSSPGHERTETVPVDGDLWEEIRGLTD
jgi:hypothetical protein